MLVKMWWNLIIHTLLVEMSNGQWPLWKKSLAVSLKKKTKYASAIQPRSCTVGHLSQRNEAWSSHKNLYTSVQSGFISNSFIHKLETTQMSFDRWMVKQSVVQPYEEILLSNKKEGIIDIGNNLDGSAENSVEWKKPIPKGCKLSDCIYIICIHSWNYKIIEMEQFIGYRGLRRGRNRREESVAIKNKHKGSLWWWNSSASWLYQC